MGAGTIKVLDSDASAATATTLHSSLSGTLDITVGGRMQENDAVILGANQTQADSKAFRMGENGVATLGLVLENIPSMDIIYVPGGVATLRPAVFKATAEVNFNDARNAGGPVRTATGAIAEAEGRLSYQGVNPAAYAYGVVRSAANGGMERSFLRVTCADTPAGCSVFLDCNGQDGTGYFGQITTDSEPLANNATEVFTSDEIAAALPGGGWESGRGQCDLLSNGNLQVQHMIRSGGIQVNNSVVIDDMGIVTNN